ncbi:MAG TPA: IS4 family transposase [Streptosporangiaceae bacterium]
MMIGGMATTFEALARAHSGAPAPAPAPAPGPEPMREPALCGFKYLKKFLPLLARLRDHACGRDKAGNRTLHYDQYCALILLSFFNPALGSLRALQKASTLPGVRKKLGVERASLGSLSEAARVFDPELLEPIIAELGRQLRPVAHDTRLDEVKAVLTLVDGTLLKALPRIAQAFWKRDKGGKPHHAFRLHVQFDLITNVPVDIELTGPSNSGDSAERSVLARKLEPGRAYVTDRGYVKWKLFNDIRAKGGHYFCRVKEDTLLEEVLEERPLSDAARAAGVTRDVVVARLGATSKGAKPSAVSDHPVRLIEIPLTPHERRGGHKGRGSGPANHGLLKVATDDLELTAEVIALVYRHRYAIEIFFRFLKQLLGCRHLLSDCPDGIRIQMYCAVIACMLLSLYTHRKPTKRTLEMVQLFFAGWATEADLLAHLSEPDNTGVKLRAKDELWRKLGVE